MPSLFCHPLTCAPMVRSVEATVSRTSDDHLEFSYRLSGDMARILTPAPQTQSRSEALWEHTCFEAFIAVAGSTAYQEFNFSPSGQSANYAFSDYRQPDENTRLTLAPQITARKTEGRLELLARLPLTQLPASYATSALQIGLSAVIENTDTLDGNRS